MVHAPLLVDHDLMFRLAFMCTGPSGGFDPICNPADAAAVALVVLVVLVAVVVALVKAVRRWRTGRSERS